MSAASLLRSSAGKMQISFLTGGVVGNEWERMGKAFHYVQLGGSVVYSLKSLNTRRKDRYGGNI